MKSYKFRINGNEYNVDINSVEGNIADVTVNGASYQVEMENAPAPDTRSSSIPPIASAKVITFIARHLLSSNILSACSECDTAYS